MMIITLTDDQRALVERATAKYAAMIDGEMTERMRVLLDRYGRSELEQIASNDKVCRELCLKLELWQHACAVCAEHGRVPFIDGYGELAWRVPT